MRVRIAYGIEAFDVVFQLPSRGAFIERKREYETESKSKSETES